MTSHINATGVRKILKHVPKTFMGQAGDILCGDEGELIAKGNVDPTQLKGVECQELDGRKYYAHKRNSKFLKKFLKNWKNNVAKAKGVSETLQKAESLQAVGGVVTLSAKETKKDKNKKDKKTKKAAKIISPAQLAS